VRCPACECDNRDGAKFCGECATRLIAVCPNCGVNTTQSQRFCDECAAPLTPDVEASGAAAAVAEIPRQPVPVAERRVVSVLFVDLVGFTPLSESRDPEAVRELLSGYFHTARTVIARYGGTIEKFIGDAVMAVWGTPTTHEDDAERCVRAALDLVDAVAEYGVTNGAAGLSARAGVVTGEVAVSLGVVGEGMVAGDAVNTAARVQGEAEPGGVLVDDVTRGATAAAIGYVDTGPHLLKGKADAVRLWQVTRVVAAVGGSERVDGLEARFLGRDREMRQVKDALHDVLENGRARHVSIVGDAGIGKSRLRWEFFKYGDGLALQFLYHSGRCLPYGEGVAYWALAEMVRARLEITEEEPPEETVAKLDSGLRRWVADEADRDFIRPRLGALLGVAEPGLSREELFAGWRLWFERLTEDAPVLLVVEDLQWADDGLLDFLDQLIDWSAEAAIFVLTLSRPEVLTRRPTWGSGRRNAVTVMLDRLPDPAMQQLLDELVPGLPADVRDRIVGQADGIPLYAVELVRSLIDRDLVQPIDGVYRLVGAVDALEVPASLTSLVAARIDTLPADERALVQGLAVLGGTFPRPAITAVSDLPADELDGLLADLIRREILRVRSDRLSPERGQYAFTQTLLRQVAYDTLSRRDRKVRHLAVAEHLRRTFADDGEEMSEVIAQHYLDAYNAVPDDGDADQVRAQASTAFARAGQRALGVGAPGAALTAFDTAAELTTDDSARPTLVEQAGQAALQCSLYEEALDRFEAAAAAHVEVGQPLAAAGIGHLAGVALMALGRIDESVRRLEHALTELEPAGPSAALAYTHSRLGGSLMFGGHRSDAEPHVEAALELGEALDLPDVLSSAAVRRATLLAFANRPQEALVEMQWAIALAEEHGLGKEAMNAQANASDQCLNDDQPGAEEHCDAAMELARRRGDRETETLVAGNLAHRYVLTGRWDEAEQLCRSMLDGSDRPGDANLHARLALLHALRGQVALADEAKAHLADWADSQDVQNRHIHGFIAAAVALAAGDLSEALALAEVVAREAADAMGLRNDMFRTAWPDAMEAAVAMGELDRADRLLAMVAELPPGNVPRYLRAMMARYRARLDAARGRHDHVDANFLDATTRFRELGYPYFLAIAQLDHAAWLVAQDRPADARELLTAAVVTFERLAATPALLRAQELMSRITHVAVELAAQS
jgi:class 3 adenylate cyclase/predicted ATPase